MNSGQRSGASFSGCSGGGDMAGGDEPTGSAVKLARACERQREEREKKR